MNVARVHCAMDFLLKHIILFCRDMGTMVDFYEHILGLRRVPTPEYSADEWVKYEAGTVGICLHKAGNPSSSPGNRSKLVFWVEDVAKAREYLISKKVKMGVHHHWPDIEASDGDDPEGNTFQVACPVDRQSKAAY